MSTILINNALIVTMTDSIFNGDVYIEDDIIAIIGHEIDKNADKVIDANRHDFNAGFC
jgi:dihydroorotase-like cyclic amidohydrolase